MQRLLPGSVVVLLVLFGVGVINSSIPLELGSPQWQLRLCDAVISQMPLVLMGLGLAVLAQQWLATSVTLARVLLWTRRAALPLALGFALLIPLQGSASLQLLQTANRNANAVVQQSDRRLNALTKAINQTGSSAELQTLIERLPAGLPPLQQLGNDLSGQQQQLIALLKQWRGRSVLEVQLNRQRQQTLLLRNSLRLSLLAALLAWLFLQLSPRRLPLGWLRLRRPQWPLKAKPSRALAAELARYCNDSSGRG
jgi:hypothetical protein